MKKLFFLAAVLTAAFTLSSFTDEDENGGGRETYCDQTTSSSCTITKKTFTVYSTGNIVSNPLP